MPGGRIKIISECINGSFVPNPGGLACSVPICTQPLPDVSCFQTIEVELVDGI